MSDYLKTMTSFSGADLICTFGNTVIGELQSISWGVERETAPIYTLGSPDPRSFTRGKRGIAGNLVFAVFNRDALLEEMKKQYKLEKNFPIMFTAAGNAAAGSRALMDEALSMIEWNNMAQDVNTSDVEARKGDYSDLAKLPPAIPPGFDLITPDSLLYADTLPPFDITLTFASETGNAAFMRILDVSILNDGSGVSVDTVVMERAMTYVARKITPVTEGTYDGNFQRININPTYK